jgi:hypothetical protein
VIHILSDVQLKIVVNMLDLQKNKNKNYKIFNVSVVNIYVFNVEKSLMEKNIILYKKPVKMTLNRRIMIILNGLRYINIIIKLTI